MNTTTTLYEGRYVSVVRYGSPATLELRPPSAGDAFGYLAIRRIAGSTVLHRPSDGRLTAKVRRAAIAKTKEVDIAFYATKAQVADEAEKARAEHEAERAGALEGVKVVNLTPHAVTPTTTKPCTKTYDVSLLCEFRFAEPTWAIFTADTLEKAIEAATKAAAKNANSTAGLVVFVVSLRMEV